MDKFSFLSNGDVNAFEDLYKKYTQDPSSVETGWARFFEGFEFQKINYEDSEGGYSENMHKEFKVLNLIEDYRQRGHLFTKTNPVRERRKYDPSLELENYGLSEEDKNTVFQSGEVTGIGPATLNQIIEHLEETYCQSIGIEYMYIRAQDRLDWLRNKIELKNRPQFTVDEKKHILHKLNQSSEFENFLQKKFVGQKRFSIEGGESLIPALDALIERGAEMGIQEFVMGMAHRGRLNVLANIFNKPMEEIFSEFEGKDYEDENFSGDVKYHLGWSGDMKTDKGHDVHLTLSPNPSHLEAVAPVVQGLTRGKIDKYLKDEKKIIPIVIHGDAAIAGQGIVYEVLQMAQLDGYRAGGSVHIVINNQVGFTTNYLDARSSTYCTDIAKTTLAPVFHVNGDDVEAVVQAMTIALEYRQTFNRDVFVDLLCYRKYGHNEGDEPKFTQPKLYKAISKHPNPRDIYLDKLIGDKVISEEEGKKLKEKFHEVLEDDFGASKQIEKATVKHFLNRTWKDFIYAKEGDVFKSINTKVAKKKLTELGDKLSTLPEGKKYFRKIVKLMKDRKAMIQEDRLDWGSAEMLAYATLLDEGHPVRISGQDVERGTFSHRHAVVITEDAEEEVVTLNNLNDKQAKFTIYNSLLSEYGVLGFEYGYSFAVPKGLTIWEAQFGDFFNGAQIMIDQFIVAAEEKWGVSNGLVILLPHGYEDMGSEHSSGRMERFLQQCADENIQIANCTTPANHYHLLRRQIKRNFRKPLIVFTPKKLLRYPEAISTLDELAKGSFKEVMDDPTVDAKKVKTVALCSGKIYYDVLEQKEAQGKGDHVALVRMEQLYPFPEKQIEDIISKYGKDKKYVWLQEEPENMGAWTFIMKKTRNMEVRFDVVSRPESGSPASGSPVASKARHQNLISELFNIK
ncbi:MAG: 2-oxoglutarate dehydrogenase E1 component [Flavobacteriales bacterium]